MPTLVIRPLNRADIAAVAALAVREHGRLFDAPELPRRTAELSAAWSKLGAPGVFVADDGQSEPAGLAVVRTRDTGRAWPTGLRLCELPPPGTAALELVWVRPELRRQGLAAALVARAVEYCEGLCLNALISYPEGEAGAALLAALGFKPAARGWTLELQSSAACQPPPLGRMRRLALPLFNPAGFWQRLQRGDRLALKIAGLLLLASALGRAVIATGGAGAALRLLAALAISALLGWLVLLGAGAVQRSRLQLAQALRLSGATLLIAAAFSALLGLLLELARVPSPGSVRLVGMLLCVSLLGSGVRLHGRWSLGLALLAGLCAAILADLAGAFSLWG